MGGNVINHYLSNLQVKIQEPLHCIFRDAGCTWEGVTMLKSNLTKHLLTKVIRENLPGFSSPRIHEIEKVLEWRRLHIFDS